MLRFALRAATITVRKLKPPFNRMQTRAAGAGYALEVSKPEVEGLLLKPDAELAEQVCQNQHAMHFLTVLKIIGTVHNRLSSIRYIMGDQLHSFSMEAAVESAEAAAEQAEDKGLLQVNAVSELRPMREQLMSLLNQIDREIKQGKESSSDYAAKQVEEIVVPILEMFKPLGMPDKQQINVAYRQAEALFKEVVTKCFSELKQKAYNDRILKAQQLLSDAMLTSEVKEQHVKDVRERLHKAEADVRAMEGKEVRLLSAEQQDEDLIRVAKRELEEINTRLRQYTWNKWGPFVEMWQRDVELAEMEQSEKLKEIAKLEEKQQGHKSQSDDFAEIGGKKAQIIARQKVIQDELQTAEKSAENAREKVKSAEAALSKIWSEIGEELKKAGVMDPKHAMMVKFMAATLQADLKVARSMERLSSPVFKGLVLQLGVLIQDVSAAKTVKDQADAIRNLLNDIETDEEVTTQTPGWVVAVRLNERICFHKLTRLVTSASAASATDVAPFLQEMEERAQKQLQE
ncbi:unnamed protein product [Symbiodinium sp. CCMP2456]|nr:unnamed protein product [Symbiodinium sp. CCMP2456]